MYLEKDCCGGESGSSSSSTSVVRVIVSTTNVVPVPPTCFMKVTPSSISRPPTPAPGAQHYQAPLSPSKFPPNKNHEYPNPSPFPFRRTALLKPPKTHKKISTLQRSRTHPTLSKKISPRRQTDKQSRPIAVEGTLVLLYTNEEHPYLPNPDMTCSEHHHHRLYPTSGNGK